MVGGLRALEKTQKLLASHKRNLEKCFKSASDFLVKCQIVEPFVREGTLRGCVCPWEIGTCDREGFTILEDFHDTLEAIWVWSYFKKLSGENTYKLNIEKGWEYVTANMERFIPHNLKNEGLYDCSHLLLAGVFYQETFSDKSFLKLLDFGGNRLADYLSRICSTRGRGYFDVWWMAAVLSNAARPLGRSKWLEASTNFVKRNLIETTSPFSEVGKEPWHRGPGGHNFFSTNANKALALLSCFPQETTAKQIISQKFLPFTPDQFVKRCVDENPWNANVAAALGKCYVSTGKEDFLRRYFAVMDELKKRAQNSALSRSETVSVRESWVTFFYAYAYASVISEIGGIRHKTNRSIDCEL